MGLKCGIIGVANTGKTTLFNCISNTKAEVSEAAFNNSKPNISIINVPDPRLIDLEKLQPTEKVTPATVEIVDIPGLTKSSEGNGVSGNKFLADIRNTDALVHVLRCFDAPALPHVEGPVDPVRDMDTVNLELQVKDLESVEKKLEKTEKLVRAGNKQVMKEYETLQIFKKHLESFKPARTAPVSDDDRTLVADLCLLSDKPVIYVCNVDEQSATSGNHYVKKVKEAVSNEDIEILVVAAALEAEIAELDDQDERLMFLSGYGLDEPGVNRLVRAAYRMLKLQTFFTIGPDEIRGWTIKMNTIARQAAGAIHSDIERGFIRAEVIKYNDFITLGSEAKCKAAGKLMVEGKNYMVEDGDLMCFRFNV